MIAGDAMPTLSPNSKAAINALAETMGGVVTTLKTKGYNLQPNGLYDLSQFKPEQFFNPPFDYENPASLAKTKYHIVAAMAAYNTVMTLKKLADANASTLQFALELPSLTSYRKLINQGVKQGKQDIICSGVIYIVDDLTLEVAINLSRFSAMASLDRNLQDNSVKTIYATDANFELRQRQLLDQFNQYAGLKKHLGAKCEQYIPRIKELTKKITELQNNISALKTHENISFLELQKYQAELNELLDKNKSLIQELTAYIESIKHLEDHVSAYEDHITQLKRVKEQTLEIVHIQLIKQCDNDLTALVNKTTDVNASLEQLKEQHRLLLAENLAPQDYAPRLKKLAEAAENHAHKCRFAASDIGIHCAQLIDEIEQCDKLLEEKQTIVPVKIAVEVTTPKPLYQGFIDYISGVKKASIDPPKADHPKTNDVNDETKKITDKKNAIEEKLTAARAQRAIFDTAATQGSEFATTAKKLANRIDNQTVVIDELQKQILNLETELNSYIKNCDSMWKKFVHLFKSEVLDKKKQIAFKLRVTIAEPSVNLINQFEQLRNQTPANATKVAAKSELLTKFSVDLNSHLQGYSKILTSSGMGKKSKLKKIIEEHQKTLEQTTKKLKR